MNKKLDITDINGMSNEEDTTCAFTDLNCVDETKETGGITDMNSADQKDETCAFTDMNCLAENKK